MMFNISVTKGGERKISGGFSCLSLEEGGLDLTHTHTWLSAVPRGIRSGVKKQDLLKSPVSEWFVLLSSPRQDLWENFLSC